eukprot:11183095-Lingulodinium_polyedra.AAC.1
MSRMSSTPTMSTKSIMPIHVNHVNNINYAKNAATRICFNKVSSLRSDGAACYYGAGHSAGDAGT